ncbi:MAG: hypothetical protein V1871_03110 [Planctomycetota bacterium]
MSKIHGLKIGMIVFLTGIIISAYGGSCIKDTSSGSSGTYTISNGTMQGIGSYVGLISATITSTPNTGLANTSIAVTITFTSGGSDVDAIKAYQKVPGGSYVYTPNLDPVEQSANVWVTSSIRLNVNKVWVKFVGVNTADTEIVSGTITLNNP